MCGVKSVYGCLHSLISSFYTTFACKLIITRPIEEMSGNIPIKDAAHLSAIEYTHLKLTSSR